MIAVAIEISPEYINSIIMQVTRWNSLKKGS